MDFSELNVPMLVLSLSLFAVILVLHVLVGALRCGISRWLNYLNIFLHIAFLLCLMFVGLEIDVAVLFFMISLFVYTLTFYIRYIFDRKEGTDGMKGESRAADIGASHSSDDGAVTDEEVTQ